MSIATIATTGFLTATKKKSIAAGAAEVVRKKYKSFEVNLLMEDCIFCKIVRGEISKERVFYMDNFSIAFLDLNPFVKGHTLVIPPKHSKWILDMDNAAFINFLLSVKNVSKILKKAFAADYIEFIIAGTDVPHTHVHLLPRFFNDELGEIPWKRTRITLEEIEEIQKKIKMALSVCETHK